MRSGSIPVRRAGAVAVVFFVKLPGFIEIMAFARHAQHRNSQNQHGDQFHRAIA